VPILDTPVDLDGAFHDEAGALGWAEARLARRNPQP
jgi:hypothetical protein